MNWRPETKLGENMDEGVLTEEYIIDALENNSDLKVITLELPHVPDSFSVDPAVHIFGEEEYAGLSVRTQESYFEDVVYGIEGSERDKKLKDGGYEELIVKPFLRGPEPEDVKRSYEIPLYSGRKFDVGVRRCQEDRENEAMVVRALDDDEEVFTLTCGRTESGWDYIAHNR